MSVYFVYRSHYDGPALKRVVRFEDASVLAWFQNRWQEFPNDNAADKWVTQEMRGPVYGFDSLFAAIGEEGLPVPRSASELRGELEEHLYVEGELLFTPHCIQVLTDDDELEMAYYFFDDHFLAKHADRAAFLLNDGWRLPGGEGDGAFRASVKTTEILPAGKDAGKTYCVFLAYYDSGNLIDIESGWHFRGVRLPDLCRHLATATPPLEWPFELKLLRSQLFLEPKKAVKQEQAFLRGLQENPQDEATWQAYSDWLEERGQPHAGPLLLRRAFEGAARYPFAPMLNTMDLRSSGQGPVAAARQEIDKLVKQLKGSPTHNPALSLTAVEEHVAQLCVHTDRWGKDDLYHQWIFFDDLWASAQPALARAILRHASRWDVLS
jgi:uncharacterized protein (TIGR02996 family)